MFPEERAGGLGLRTLSMCTFRLSVHDFTLDFYFRQFWTDPRLAFRKRQGVETLSVGSEFIKNIWVPDTFFVNEKQSYFHIATTSNEFIRIHHSGSITRSIRKLPEGNVAWYTPSGCTSPHFLPDKEPSR
ncbi:unnamed protein product [Timema podura]|uniref:Neurotransmitter-gated ion-channel ligand-binding domain-containing protein n=1 Tax=Timema podura TaxID=61482 RepID=A0ABN7NTT1_TIMPD|nr:unnamed protein product [Timema podura]